MAAGIRVAIATVEVALATLFVVAAVLLPDSFDVARRLGKVGELATTAEGGLRLIDTQIGAVRDRDLPEITLALRVQAESLAGVLREPTLDFTSLDTISQSLKETAAHLDDWGDMLTNRGEAAVDEDRQAVVSTIGGPQAAVGLGAVAELRSADNRVAGLPLAARRTLLETERTLERTTEQLRMFSRAELPMATPQGLEFRPLWPEGDQAVRQLEDAYAALRSVNQALDQASAPLIADSVKRAAATLGESHRKMEQLLSQRLPYEQAVRDGRRLAERVTRGVAVETAMLDVRLSEQQKSIRNLRDGLADFDRSLPTIVDQSVTFLWLARLCLATLACLVGLHGMLLFAGARVAPGG